jgi:hypothetical protein
MAIARNLIYLVVLMPLSRKFECTLLLIWN